MGKTARQLAAAKRTAKLLRKDPEHFAKIAAKRKGEKNSNMARPITTEQAQKAGLSKGVSVKYKQRKQRSEDLQRKLQREQEETIKKAKNEARLLHERKENKYKRVEVGEWDEEETTDVGEWE